MKRWFRFYDEALDDPKVQRLSPQLFKTWVNLLCLASKEDGKLPSNDDIAFRLRISVQDAALQIEDLILAGLIDLDARGNRAPHNWSERQYASDSSAERMRKHRKSKKEKTCDVTCDGRDEKSDAVDTDSEADTEKDIDTPLPPSGAVRVEKALPKFGRLEALEAFNAYNAVALRCALPQAAKLTPNRERSIVARLKDYGLDGWHKALANIEKSKFLTGGTDAGFRADLDFVCQAKSFGKLHDGGYGNGRHTAKAPAATSKSVFAHPPKERDEDWQDEIAKQWLRENAGAVQ